LSKFDPESTSVQNPAYVLQGQINAGVDTSIAFQSQGHKSHTFVRVQ